ncbi:MAG: hypothetical protein HUK05_08580, partial [Prevotella sp.]|nr:hypothetical protein [Prevotella sp.]
DRTKAGDMSAPIDVYMHIGLVPGAKLVQISDGGVAKKGLFVPFDGINGLVSRRGKIIWKLRLIPYPDGVATHLIVPCDSTREEVEAVRRNPLSIRTKHGSSFALKLGSAYTMGRKRVTDLRQLDDIREKYGKKRLYTE